MSSPRRHGFPKKRPDPPAKDEISAELPELEPLQEELPTLELVEEVPAEPVDEGPVKLTCTVADEANFDTVLTVEVPAMDKKAVAEAVGGPLRRAAGRHAAQLRHRRVLVRFTGEAVVGSAVKELVGEVFKPGKPLKLVVRRGFGDETVHEGVLPQVAVATQAHGDTVKVEFATGSLEAADLPAALAPQLLTLAATARDKKFALHFTGAAKPDAGVREQITKALRDAGAVRAAIGARVLFDRELADRVRVSDRGETGVVEVKPADDEALTLEALSMVVPDHGAMLAGKAVRVHFAREPRHAERSLCIDLLRKAGAMRIEFGDGRGEGDCVWPSLLHLVVGGENVVRVVPDGRGRSGILQAFRREIADHAAAVKGKAVVVDWPKAFVLDAEVVDGCLRAAIDAWSPKSLACTIGGELREPFAPEPVVFGSAGDLRTVVLDTDAGKPAELLRAFERRSMAEVGRLRGKAVRLQIVGSAAASRTLVRTVATAIEAAGAMQLELEDHGTIDVLLPAMLTVTWSADLVRIAAVVGPRDPAQQALALQRELDAAGLPKGANVAVGSSNVTDSLVAALVARGAARVLVDGPAPVQVHPPLFGPTEKKGTNLRIAAAPAADAAMTVRQVDRELPALLASVGDCAALTVTLAWPGATDATAEPVARVLQALVARHAAKVLLDGGSGKPLQVHPPVPVAAPAPASAVAQPAAATAAVAATVGVASAGASATGASLLTVLARKDEAVPPLLVLGVEAGSDAGHVAAVEQQLQAHLAKFRGRCVLLVLRNGGQDVPVRRPEPLVAMLGRLVPTAAAATLVFRGPDAQGRPHFQVLHSTLRALPVGSTFGDPRGKR